MGALLVEQVVRMPITNPATDGKSRTFEFLGKVDLVKDRKVNDWKGVSSPGHYLQRAKIGFQGECYALALMHGGQELDEIVYRLIQRPALRRSVPKHSWAVMREGCKRAIRVFDTQEAAETHRMLVPKAAEVFVESRSTGDVTWQDFEERCFQQFIEEPGRVVEVAYAITPSRMATAREWLWDCTKRLLDCRQHDRWMPCAGACRAYNRDCPYIPLCEAICDGADTETLKADLYSKSPPHSELDGATASSGFDIVTHSSLSKLALCEVRYFWRYEAGLIRGAESSEPLWTGSAMHAGMEAYATGGEEAALAAVDTWADANPVLGPDAADSQDTQVARAKAMCRAAALRWPR